jgi:inhibitor of cysteine peptidase
MSVAKVLGESDNGKTADIAPGEMVEIRLPDNPTTGFKWVVASPSQPVCEVLPDSEYRPPERPVPGAPGERVWRVRATRSGICDIELHYLRPWQPAGAAAKRFTLHVRVR